MEGALEMQNRCPTQKEVDQNCNLKWLSGNVMIKGPLVGVVQIIVEKAVRGDIAVPA